LRERISQLEGVLSVRVSKNNGEIDEIHVLSEEGRDPKRLVRDIETVFQVETGLSFDHKKISIARINEQKEEKECKERIELKGVYLRRKEPICTVELKYRGEEKSYKFEGNELDDPPQIVLKTLVKAIETLLKTSFQIKIKDIKKLNMEQNVIFVMLTVNESGKEEDLMGVSLIEENLPLAVSKAFFHALNRKLEMVMAV